MNNQYRRGVSREYKLVKELKDNGFVAVRSAGSHSPYDVWGVNLNTKTLVLIQSKSEQWGRFRHWSEPLVIDNCKLVIGYVTHRRGKMSERQRKAEKLWQSMVILNKSNAPREEKKREMEKMKKEYKEVTGTQKASNEDIGGNAAKKFVLGTLGSTDRHITSEDLDNAK